MNATEISLSALDVEWRRLEVITQNLANASSIRTAGGDTYQPRYLVSGPKGGFAALLEGNSARTSATAADLQGVEVYSIETSDKLPQKVYDPSNPQADADGFISLPDVDEAREMTMMLRTSRIYEANLAALNIARQMYGKALELGRQS